jgi:hypothetical protein
MPSGKQDGNERVRQQNLRDRQYVELKLAIDYLQVANRVMFRIMEDQGVPSHQFGVLFPIEAVRMLGGNTLQEAEEIFEKRKPYLQALLQVPITDEYLTMLRTLLLQDYESRKAQKEHPKDAIIHGVT